MAGYFETNSADSASNASLGRASVKAGTVTVIARAATALGQIGSVLFLSRLLSPEDYGLVAMVMAITGFAPLIVDLGTRDAVVQRLEVTEGEVSAMFWVTVAVGCALGALVAACGPMIARFYGEPRIVMIAVVSSLNFVVVGLINQHQALMRRALMFQELAVIEVVANVASAVLAVVMAFVGFGYWALVTRSLSMYCVMAVGVWYRCGWIPGRPQLTDGVKSMLRFGVGLTGFTFVDCAGKNIDRVAIGRGLGSRVLGHYQQALFVYYNILDTLVYTLHQVAISGLSKLQNEPEEFRRCWSTALSTVAFYVMPCFGLLAVTSQDVVVLLLGEPWMMAGLILSVLALRGIPHAIERTTGWLYVATGQTDRWMRYGMAATGVQVIALLSGLPFGTMGVAVTYTASMYVWFLPAVAYAGRPMQIGMAEVIRCVGRPLVGSLAAAGLGICLRHWIVEDTNALVRVLVGCSVYALVYLGIVVGAFKVRTPLTLVKRAVGDLARTVLARNAASGRRPVTIALRLERR